MLRMTIGLGAPPGVYTLSERITSVTGVKETPRENYATRAD